MALGTNQACNSMSGYQSDTTFT